MRTQYTNLHSDYRLSNGQCYYVPRNPSDACCLQFDHQNKCIRCAKGLLRNPQTGICEDVKIEGCLKKGESACESCAKGYDLAHGVCFKTISNCVSYNKAGECAECHSKAQLFKGTCVPKIQFPFVSHCKTHYEYGCAVCEKGYRVDVSDRSCKPVSISGCLKYDTNGACVSCLSPHYLLYKGQCIVAGCTKYSESQCISCQSALGF